MRYTPTDITSTYAAIAPINANFDAIATLIEKCVFTDGTTPNSMEADLDLNHFSVHNLAAPVNPNDAARLIDVQTSSNGSLFAVSDYANQAAVQAAAPASLFLPSGKALSVSGAMTKKFWGPGNVFLGSGAVPGTQGGAASSFLVMETATAGTGQHFTLTSKVFTGTRTDTGSAPGQNHCVAGYFEAQRGAGSSDGVWGLNTLTEVYNLLGATIGGEVDINNFSGSDPGLSPTFDFNGFQIISGGSGKGGTALVIARNGAFGSNHWNRGLYVKDTLGRGIEFANCGNGTGIWADNTFNFVQTANTGFAVISLTPFDDLNPGNAAFKILAADGSTLRMSVAKRGEILIGVPTVVGSNGLGIKGIANGDNLIFLQRSTDTSPTGEFLRCTNASGSTVLFDLDYNTVANETNMKLSVSGASAVRVSVGAADSAGTGFRTVRVPN